MDIFVDTRDPHREIKELKESNVDAHARNLHVQAICTMARLLYLATSAPTHVYYYWSSHASEETSPNNTVTVIGLHVYAYTQRSHHVKQGKLGDMHTHLIYMDIHCRVLESVCEERGKQIKKDMRTHART